jgi:hypothetical protein
VFEPEVLVWSLVVAPLLVVSASAKVEKHPTKTIRHIVCNNRI